MAAVVRNRSSTSPVHYTGLFEFKHNRVQSTDNMVSIQRAFGIDKSNTRNELIAAQSGAGGKVKKNDENVNPKVTQNGKNFNVPTVRNQLAKAEQAKTFVNPSRAGGPRAQSKRASTQVAVYMDDIAEKVSDDVNDLSPAMERMLLCSDEAVNSDKVTPSREHSTVDDLSPVLGALVVFGGSKSVEAQVQDKTLVKVTTTHDTAMVDVSKVAFKCPEPEEIIAFCTALTESRVTQAEIDEDLGDISMVAEYAEEIFTYLAQVEHRLCPDEHYLDFQTELQPHHRSVVIEWLTLVHIRFRLLPETMYLTINILDRFLSNKFVSHNKLQLAGIVAMYIAAKYEEVNCPNLQEVCYMVDKGFTADEILKAEKFMLNLLGWELGWPGPLTFLRRISKADEYDTETRNMAKYFIEVGMMDQDLVGSLPSFVAAGAHCLARLMLNKGGWTAAHVHYSGYLAEEIEPVVKVMYNGLISPRAHHYAIFDKYASEPFGHVAEIVHTRMFMGWKMPQFATAASFNDRGGVTLARFQTQKEVRSRSAVVAQAARDAKEAIKSYIPGQNIEVSQHTVVPYHNLFASPAPGLVQDA